MSNHTNDPWETEMSRTFDQRVRDLHEAPLDLDQVKGKAGKIRRNRRIAVAGGVLAVAAVVVPVAVFAGGALDNDSAPPVAPQPNETATDTEGPGFNYLEGKTLHRADGSTMTFPDRYRGGAVLGETIFAIRSDDDTGQLHLDVIEPEVVPTETTEILSGPVMNDDRTMVAYIESDGDLVARSEQTQTTVATGLGPNSSLTAATGDCTTGACRLYVDDDTLEPLVYDESGESSVPVPDVVGVQDADEAGHLAVQISSQDAGSCGGVYDLAKSDYLWDTCDFYLFGFSPGGKYVEATHPYLDGFGHAYASILDAATGKELFRFDPPGAGALTTSAWEDSEHLLVSAFEYKTSEWTVFRIAADGTHEAVLGPTKGSDFEPPFIILNGK